MPFLNASMKLWGKYRRSVIFLLHEKKAKFPSFVEKDKNGKNVLLIQIKDHLKFR